MHWKIQSKDLKVTLPGILTITYLAIATLAIDLMYFSMLQMEEIEKCKLLELVGYYVVRTHLLVVVGLTN